MLKVLIVLSSLFLIDLAFASEISLICKIQSTYTASNGETIKENGRAIVEVTEQVNYKMILITSEVADATLGVTTRLPSNFQGQVQDFSTKSKWEIHNDITRDDMKMENRILIDRVSGILVASSNRNRNGKFTSTNVSGDCAKADANNKKF